MPISYTDVEDSVLLKKASFYGAKEYVRVNVDPATRNLNSFPNDYEFAPCFLPKKYVRLADRFENSTVRPDDTWIVTFPKAGTTWIMNIVQYLKNNLDFSLEYLNAGSTYLEGTILHDVNNENSHDDKHNAFISHLEQNLNNFDNNCSPRLIKSHLPAHLLPKDIWTVKPKVIYMHRNAKDVAISMYHMFRSFIFLKYQGSMEDFFDIFMNDHIVYGPFYAHVNGFRKLNRLDHILVLNYDEMIANPFDEVKRISEFLNCTYSDGQLKRLTEHVSFQNMRSHSQTDTTYFLNDFNFFRKGKSGGYRDEMKPDYIRMFDEWEEQEEKRL